MCSVLRARTSVCVCLPSTVYCLLYVCVRVNERVRVILFRFFFYIFFFAMTCFRAHQWQQRQRQNREKSAFSATFTNSVSSVLCCCCCWRCCCCCIVYAVRGFANFIECRVYVRACALLLLLLVLYT